MSFFPPRVVKCGYLDFLVDPLKPAPKKDGVTSGAAATVVEKKERKKTSRKKYVIELTEPQLKLLRRAALHVLRLHNGFQKSTDDQRVLLRILRLLPEV